MPDTSIIVIGGGIIGASIAWHLARRGANVTLIAAQTGGVATPNSFAWINANWGNPEHYFHLRRASMEGWRRLAGEVPGIKPDWCGSICYDLPVERLEAFAREHSAWGYGIERLQGSAVAELEPNLRDEPQNALLIAEEGMIEPVDATLALLKAAENHGAKVLAGRTVSRLIKKNDRVCGVEFENGDILEADEVIVSAGAASRALGATIGLDIPVDAAPGLLMHSKPVQPMIRHIIVAPDLELRQTRDGRIVAATSYAGSEPGDDPDKTARNVLALVKSHLKHADGLDLEHFTIGYRPMPADGFPIVSRVAGQPGLYIAVTHSGITLAPAIGDMVADEILTGVRNDLLSPFGHDRFTALNG